MKILVVDDTKSMQDCLSDFLGKLGHSVGIATNGLDAFEKAQQDNYHLYIIDHKMPLMDGIQLTKNLKKTKQCASTPILFMTTQALNTLKKSAEFPLFSAVISKPINEASFLSIFNPVVEKIIIEKDSQSILKQVN